MILSDLHDFSYLKPLIKYDTYWQLFAYTLCVILTVFTHLTDCLKSQAVNVSVNVRVNSRFVQCIIAKLLMHCVC